MTQEETLNWLDSLEHYKLIADENELKWFFDHVVKPLKRHEAYAFCLSSRHKKLTEEERKGTGLGRSEMLDPTVVFPNHEGQTTFERFKRGIRLYECHKEAFTTKEGKPFPAKTLVLYFHINPCDELKAISDLKGYINVAEQELIDSSIKDIDRANFINNLLGPDLTEFLHNPNAEHLDMIQGRIKALKTRSDTSGVAQSIDKICYSLSKLKRLQFDNVGTKYWVDFDVDLCDTKDKDFMETVLHTCFAEKMGKGNFYIVETGGGFHILVNKECIKFNPDEFINDILHTSISMTGIVSDLVGEMKYNTNAMIPLPGTYMYGHHVVRIVNKNDFE